jgi:hypothetical protein
MKRAPTLEKLLAQALAAFEAFDESFEFDDDENPSAESLREGAEALRNAASCIGTQRAEDRADRIACLLEEKADEREAADDEREAADAAAAEANERAEWESDSRFCEMIAKLQEGIYEAKRESVNCIEGGCVSNHQCYRGIMEHVSVTLNHDGTVKNTFCTGGCTTEQILRGIYCTLTGDFPKGVTDADILALPLSVTDTSSVSVTEAVPGPSVTDTSSVTDTPSASVTDDPEAQPSLSVTDAALDPVDLVLAQEVPEATQSVTDVAKRPKCPCGKAVSAERNAHSLRLAGIPAKFCSNACRQRAYRERGGDEARERDAARKRAERG